MRAKKIHIDRASSTSGVYYALRAAKVSCIIDQGSRRWPRQRNRIILNILRHTPPLRLTFSLLLPILIRWFGLTIDGFYATKSAWEACRHRNPFQPWHAIVWFSQGIPRWTFIEWMDWSLLLIFSLNVLFLWVFKGPFASVSGAGLGNAVSKKARNVIYKLSLGATIYFLWGTQSEDFWRQSQSGCKGIFSYFWCC